MKKIELHAHLNGCIRKSTFIELATKKNIDLSAIADNFGKTLERCFLTFGYVHEICDSLDVVQRITEELIVDFIKQNVVYFEIRTAPKVYPGKTMVDYIDAVVSIMRKYESDNFHARLIICVNRSSPLPINESIIETAILLKEKMHPYIVAVDFCGDPTKGRFKDVEPLFVKARAAGYRVTLHAGEIANYPDNDDIVAFRPDRLGHCAMFSQEQVENLKKLRIPIESCASSNLNTLGKGTYADVPNIKWMKGEKYPFSLCTDDTILFNNDATGERFEVANAFGYSESELLELERNVVNFIFDEESKPWLAKLLE